MIKLFKKIYYYFFIKKITYNRNKNDDRYILEEIIFPFILTNYNPQKILDIGREDYEIFYNEFFKNRELWTIDIDPKRREFGAKNHITDNVVNLEKYFKNNTFDFILFNGVYGWGLNKEKDVQDAFNAIFNILKKGGILVFGWNDEVVPFSKINGLLKLEPFYLKPLRGTSFTCNNGAHHYNFFIKN